MSANRPSSPSRLIADEPLDVEFLAHRAPDPRVVRLHLRDAVQLKRAVQHADVRCHVHLEGAGVLLVEPGDVGVEVGLLHARAPNSRRYVYLVATGLKRPQLRYLRLAPASTFTPGP